MSAEADNCELPGRLTKSGRLVGHAWAMIRVELCGDERC